MVAEVGLEPTLVAQQHFECCVSTNSTTRPQGAHYRGIPSLEGTLTTAFKSYNYLSDLDRDGVTRVRNPVVFVDINQRWFKG